MIQQLDTVSYLEEQKISAGLHLENKNKSARERGYGDETKGDETKIRKLWRNASHISFVESNNFRNFPRSGMGNKTKIK